MKELTLKEPIEMGNKRIEVLEFKPLKAKDIRKLKDDPSMDDILNLVGVSTGLMKPEVDELGIEDAMEAASIVTSFFKNGQKTGDE